MLIFQAIFDLVGLQFAELKLPSIYFLSVEELYQLLLAMYVTGRELNSASKLELDELSRLDGFLLNPLIQGHSGTATKTSRNAYGTNERMRTTPRMIFILKQVSFRVRPHETLAQKLVRTTSFFKLFIFG